MVDKSIFVYIIILSLFACGRPEFGKASTEDKVVTSTDNNDSSPVGKTSDENNDSFGANNATSGGAYDPAPEERIPTVYGSFLEHDNFSYAPKSIAQIFKGLFLLADDDSKYALERFEYNELSSFSTTHFASLWIDDSRLIENDLIDALTNINLDVRQISLSSPDTRSHINNVAREQTEGYLAELFPATQSVGGDLLLTTGSFYTLAFKNAFDTNKTYRNTFFGKTTSERDFMVQSGRYGIVDNADLTALSIEMENESVLVLMMPKSQFEDLESQISADFIERLLPEMTEKTAEVHIPKMDFVNTFSYSDFSNIVDLERLSFERLGEGARLGEVVHQVRFILNEQGIENDSPQVIADALGETDKISFDRPFVFSVYNSSAKEVELLGRFTD